MAKLLPLLLPGLAAFLFANANKSGDSIVHQIRSHHKGIGIWWTGNDGWLMKWRTEADLSVSCYTDAAANDTG
ncbi:MAG TPA: hypothetical protein VLI55_15540 [Bryobacteraceae bacterium]|nr:hypothetical protein [Bryobacteraceae bacterium]